MNQTSRTDDNLGHPGWNQNPSSLNADATTRQDLNGMVNLRDRRLQTTASEDGAVIPPSPGETTHPSAQINPDAQSGCVLATTVANSANDSPQSRGKALTVNISIPRFLRPIVKFASFIGPGFLIAVAYIDPGNYATDAAAGASSQYALLFVVLMSNLFAVFLQSLCIKLGSVTGLNLAENCRCHLPKWLTICLYVLSEAAIVATDIAEVIGSAIALNLLLKVPLVAGCVITLADVLVLLIFYRPQGSMWGLRAFEFFVMLLVLGVVICFCIQLSLVKIESVGEVFRGYLPSPAVINSTGLYQSCGILGATVMPHSLFLGSGTVQPRLREFDIKAGHFEQSSSDDEDDAMLYRPSISAIRGCLKYSILELSLCLFTFALFVNSAILIVAAAALYGTPGADNADLFGIHQLLSQSIAPAAGTIFGLALLLSGLSAGIVCTIAGQMVSEGMIKWTCKPWIRRLLTRVISIVPSVIIAAAVGREGLDTALTASQVVLSVILPFVVAPLIYFTARNKFMTVETDESSILNNNDRGNNTTRPGAVKMRNSWPVTALAFFIWLAITIMDVAALVFMGLGQG